MIFMERNTSQGYGSQVTQYLLRYLAGGLFIVVVIYRPHCY